MSAPLAPHEAWWEEQAAVDGEFGRWLTESDRWSREEVRRIAEAARAKTILEVGPGMYVDWTLHWATHETIRYQAVERTPKFAAAGRAQGIPVVDGSIVDLPLPSASVDVAYCRHVLEHLAMDDHLTALDELWRVAKKAMIVVFFQLHLDRPEHEAVADTTLAPGTYCHWYSRHALEAALEARGMIHRTWTTNGRDHVLTCWKKPPRV